MAEQIYRYKAFISYRHVDPDRRWAKWLIDSLETFRTPRSLVAHGVPSHIGHLFRDDEEIPASSNLSNQIEEALKASQYLIVVCSPNTPKSQWCRHEIDYFRKLGKGDRILALLIEGEPDESFPPELLHVSYEVTHADGSKTTEMRDEEPIASDVRPRDDETKHVTERRALIRIAATLLGVAFDDLAQRDHQRAVRRQRIIGAAIATAVLLVAAIGGWYWDHTRVKTAYYADIGSRFAEPFGIGELNHSDATHRWASYEVQSLRGHVIHVRRINGLGGLHPLKGNEVDTDPWNSTAAEWVVRYEGDTVRTVIVFSATGKVLRTETYDITPQGTGLVKFAQQSGALATLSSNVTDFRTRVSETGIARRPDVMQHALTFTPEGYIARRVFQTVYTSVAQDENGNAGRDYTYTGDGQVATVRVLNSNGASALGAGGAAEERRSYTPAGDLARFDLRGLHGEEVYAIVLRYDDQGNPVDKLWTGSDGKPVLNTDDKVAEERDSYDPHGNLIHARFFNEAGQPTSNGMRYAQYANDYDSLGRVTRTSYFNVYGAPVLSAKMVASAATVLDGAGNVVGIHLFGLNGKPAIGTAGYATMLQRFDAARDPVEIRYFGPDDKPMLNNDGLAILRSSFDPRGNLVDQSWYDTNDRLVNSDGYARAHYSHDERGNRVLEEFYNADGRRAINHTAGVAAVHYEFTEHGDWSQVDFIGVDGKPFAKPDTNAARITFSYDGRDNPTGELFFDAKQARVNSPAGFSSLEQIYNADDEVVEQHFTDTNDQPVMTAFGYAGTRSRYDAHGNEVELTFLDTADKPVNGIKGYAHVRKKYDANRHEIEDRYFDALGNAVMTGNGFAILRTRYDRRGNKVEFATYDLNDRPVTGSALGFAVTRDVYDDRGLLVQTAYYDASGKLVAAADGWALKKVAYDDSGNLVDLAYYSAPGRLVMYKAPGARFAYARVHLTFRTGGELVNTTYYDDKGRSAVIPALPHRNK